ncbi:pentatricopeptide repeat-containing protein 2, mitochondrial isoform X1 [Danio rerio]|uniref:Pentatricopeptide repeat-containing protein 2, mitochondrial n=2 Tax=Danio rerio TaxID=7955 RepID=F1QQL7_DANRE|nr:pentatricopeptide repeat-containing protein 2, mitochondrial isoform X1 [Danio rerio]|eukprot:XP_005171908.1 pentatricopeptide repeat-containing protein 2, mitochondrial isoform X1 [Danio rerio]
MALQALNIWTRVILTDASRAAVFRGSLQSHCFKCRHGAKRFLLSEDVVKLQEFQQKKLSHEMSQLKDYRFDIVNQKLEKNEIILKTELKTLLHSCQSAEDVIVARNVIKRYHENNRTTVFGEFKFGPLFMRLCYELGLEELAATTIKDPALKGFFSDTTSFNITIDMLFNKQLYESGLEVVGEMKKQGVSLSRDTFMLVFAICYKLNTSRSYHICLTLLEEGQTKGNIIPRRAYCFAIALALKQNDLERAQIFYSHIMSTGTRLCQNLRVFILAVKGSMKEAVYVLKTARISETPVLVRKPEFSREVVNVLRRKSAGSVWEERVEQVLTQLEKAGQITEMTLDDLLCYTPSRKRRLLELPQKDRQIKQRTRKSLQSGLLLE